MAAQRPTTTYERNGVNFVVDSRYILDEDPLGKGAYGVVVGALDTLTGHRVAVKRIGGVFDHIQDSKRCLRELKLLSHLSGHDNIVQILDVMPVDEANFGEIYIVTELMDTDLYQIIKSDQPLSQDHCRHFMYHVLRGLKYIHSANILHRDLKPGNIVLNANCDTKIIDFGLARPDIPAVDRIPKTEYVATRWYRAPEIIYDNGTYTKAVDIWAVGCIMAELILRKPIFPGKDMVEQLALQLKVVGTPTPAHLERIRNENARNFIKNLKQYPRMDFRRLFPGVSPQAADLLDSMLALQASDRPSASDCLAHPYFEELHDPEDEPVCTPCDPFDFDSEALDMNMLRRLIANEVSAYNNRVNYNPNISSVLTGEELAAVESPGVQEMDFTWM